MISSSHMAIHSVCNWHCGQLSGKANYNALKCCKTYFMICEMDFRVWYGVLKG